MLDYFSWPSNLWRQGRIRIDAELARLYHRNEDSGGELKILRCQTGATNAVIASMLLGDLAWLKTEFQGNLVKNRLKYQGPRRAWRNRQTEGMTGTDQQQKHVLACIAVGLKPGIIIA